MNDTLVAQTGFAQCPHGVSGPNTYCSACSELARARVWYFTHGGVESDAGPRPDATWYYRRTVIALDDKVNVFRDLLCAGIDVAETAREYRKQYSSSERAFTDAQDALDRALATWDLKHVPKALQKAKV